MAPYSITSSALIKMELGIDKLCCPGIDDHLVRVAFGQSSAKVANQSHLA
jgi:hypothetical protein